MDWVKLGELGAVVLAMLTILILVEVIRRRYRESDTGERRDASSGTLMIKCPNRVEGLSATLAAISEECRTMTALNQEQLRHLQHNREQIDGLVKAHQPVAGREWWKTTEKSEHIQEEIRDGIRDLVRLAKANGGPK